MAGIEGEAGTEAGRKEVGMEGGRDLRDGVREGWMERRKKWGRDGGTKEVGMKERWMERLKK